MADTGNNRIEMIAASTYALTTVADLGGADDSGDGQAATDATENAPLEIGLAAQCQSVQYSGIPSSSFPRCASMQVSRYSPQCFSKSADCRYLKGKIDVKAKDFGIAFLGVCLGMGSVLAQGQGVETRYLPDKPGFWQPQRYMAEQDHGAGATVTELQQINANWKAIQAVLMETPTGTNPVGFYYFAAPMWVSKGRTRPILQGLHIYPLPFFEIKKQGVWTLDMHGETSGAGYSLNNLSEIERVSSKVFEETGPIANERPIYIAPKKAASLGGFPVYGDTLFISRPGRELFVPVTVEHALRIALVIYARNRDAAEHELAQRRQLNQAFIRWDSQSR